MYWYCTSTLNAGATCEMQGVRTVQANGTSDTLFAAQPKRYKTDYNSPDQPAQAEFGSTSTVTLCA